VICRKEKCLQPYGRKERLNKVLELYYIILYKVFQEEGQGQKQFLATRLLLKIGSMGPGRGIP